jgi:hypothetical protein
VNSLPTGVVSENEPQSQDGFDWKKTSTGILVITTIISITSSNKKNKAASYISPATAI